MDEDQKHFKQLFYELYEPLCNYAFRYLRDRDHSEDIVQEIMMKIWETQKDLFTDNSLKYYIYVAVKNKCISSFRKKIYMLDIDKISTDIADEIYEIEPSKDIDELIESAFKGIPPKCLEIFKLSRIENLSYKQIAEKLDISIKTVENQMGKAIKHIREFIKHHPILTILVGGLITILLRDLKEFVFYLKVI